METDRSIYLTIAELARRYEAPSGGLGDQQPLTRYELRCFSQHGEDGVIAEILSRVGISSRAFVEFGIETGREGNCVFLADVLEWRGLFIEPNYEFHTQLARKYAGTPRITTLQTAVTPDNVESLFMQSGVPTEIDVLSIDVDGADYWIWEQITGWRPRVLVIEYNAALPVDQALVQPPGEELGWQGTDYFGASLSALESLGERQGYRLVHTDLSAANAFFVRADLAHDRFPLATAVPRRTEPNYFMTGYHHPPDASDRRYLEVEVVPSPDARRVSGPVSTLPPTSSHPSAADAEALAARTDFIWHQRFELAPGIFSPGPNNVEFLMAEAQMADRLDGESVLDIGTTNGGVAFELERRGAGKVVAVDILDADTFGFNAIKQTLGSSVEHLQASVYELPEILNGEQYDLVVFLGVIYHLRHPLLALDNVRRLTRGAAYVESAICDAELPEVADQAVARFYRQRELGNDPTNWFAPTLVTLADWCASCGLEPFHTSSWPQGAPTRGMVSTRPAPEEPEWQRISYEHPLRARVHRP
jgi:SAM-dependent methyltransferase